MDFFNFHYIITILRKDRHVTFKKKKSSKSDSTKHNIYNED